MPLKILKPAMKMAPGRPVRMVSARTQRWAGRKLQAWRDRILTRDCGLCQPCQREGRLTPARDVDHIVPLEDGGTYDESNGQAICLACHKAKTAAQRGYRSAVGG